MDVNPFDGNGVDLGGAVVDLAALALMAKGGQAGAKLAKQVAETGVHGLPVSFLAKHPVVSTRVLSPASSGLNYVYKDIPALSKVTAAEDLVRKHTPIDMPEHIVQFDNAIVPNTMLSDYRPDEQFANLLTGENTLASQFANLSPQESITATTKAGSLLPAQGMKDIIHTLMGRPVQLVNKAGKPFGKKARAYTAEQLPAEAQAFMDNATHNLTLAPMQELVNKRKAMGGAIDRAASTKWDTFLSDLAAKRPDIVDSLRAGSEQTGIPLDTLTRGYSLASRNTTEEGAMRRLAQAVENADKGVVLPEADLSKAGRKVRTKKYAENKLINEISNEVSNPFGADLPMSGKTGHLNAILQDLAGTGGKDTAVLDTRDLKYGINMPTASDVMPDYIMKEKALYDALTSMVSSGMSESQIMDLFGKAAGGKVSGIQSILRGAQIR